MTTRPYPVISERTLDRPRSRLVLFAKRDLSELPRQEPGTVLVFEANGQLEVLRDRRHLTGREEIVVEAVAVSLVDVRERPVPVDLVLPSISPADNFRLRVTFRCRVVDPQAVVRSGVADVTGRLSDHLLRDRRLEEIAIRYRIDEINYVRDEITAQIKAYCTLHPPRVPGLAASLSTVEVSPPPALVDQAKKMRDEEWRHVYQRLRRNFEEEDARWLADLVRSGPEAVEGLAMSRGDITAGQAADRAYSAQDEKQRRLLEILEVLQKDGHLDRLRVDADTLVEAFTDSITPRRAERAAELGERPPRPTPRSVTAADTDDGADLVIDEDELDDDDPRR